MCEATADFTTIAGTRDQVEWMMDRWEEMRLVTGERLWERGIRIRWYDLAELGEEYQDPDCGAVAVAFHESGDAARAAASVSSVLFRANHGAPTGLVCEPGHTFVGDSSGVGPGPAPLDLGQLQRARQRVPQLPKRAGSRVALLDTGDDASGAGVVDFTTGLLNTNPPPGDPHGHGSAVAQAIRSISPHAELKPFRVLDAANRGKSFSIYQGLIAALWDGQGCDVVNASLGVEATERCGTSLGTTFNYLMTLRSSKQRYEHQAPALVVAAGNNRTSLRSPATVDGAYVVTAIDFEGNPAPYCSELQVPLGVAVHAAPGGVHGDPLGRYANGAEVYGTSFAAGLVSGALLG